MKMKINLLNVDEVDSSFLVCFSSPAFTVSDQRRRRRCSHTIIYEDVPNMVGMIHEELDFGLYVLRLFFRTYQS